MAPVTRSLLAAALSGLAIVEALPPCRVTVFSGPDGALELRDVGVGGGVVMASYTNDTEGSGWGYLEVKTVASEVTDMEEMLLIYRAAGFAEGTQGLWSRLRLPNDCGDLLFLHLLRAGPLFLSQGDGVRGHGNAVRTFT